MRQAGCGRHAGDAPPMIGRSTSWRLSSAHERAGEGKGSNLKGPFAAAARSGRRRRPRMRAGKGGRCRRRARRQGQRRLIRAQEGEGQDGRQQGCRSKTDMRGHRGFPRGTGYGVQPAPAAAGRQGCASASRAACGEAALPGGCRDRRQFSSGLTIEAEHGVCFNTRRRSARARAGSRTPASHRVQLRGNRCVPQTEIARRRGAAARYAWSASSLPSACRCPASSSLPFW